MTDQETPFRSEDGAPELLPPAHKQKFQRIFATQAVRSYLFLSLGMGLMAFFLPILLIAVAHYHDHFSISYFYYTGDPSRNIFVGFMYAIGVFLILFHGLSNIENWILNAAGAAAIVVAMRPMPIFTKGHPTQVEQQCSLPKGGLPSVHAVSAIFFFLCLAVVAIFFAKGRVKYITDLPMKRMFIAAYNVTGFLMIALPATVMVLYYRHGARCENHHIFAVEWAGIVAFSLFWFVKTYEYKRLLRIR